MISVIDIEEYQHAIGQNYPDLYDYHPLLKSFGHGILFQHDYGKWQGDSRLIFVSGDEPIRFGYLVFGWGSCSGCDALQSCKDFEELERLQKRLMESIIWFDTVGEMRKWFDRDWAGDFDLDQDFINVGKILLDDAPLVTAVTKFQHQHWDAAADWVEENFKEEGKFASWWLRDVKQPCDGKNVKTILNR